MITKDEILAKRKEFYAKPQGKNPRYTTWASQAGENCLRKLYYYRTQWEQIPELPPEIQPRLEVGRALHDLAIQRFKNWGYEVREGLDSLRDDNLEVSGKLDFEVSKNGEVGIPVEVKSMQDFAISGLNSIADFLHSRKPWLKKYIAQLLLYLYLRNKPRGFLYLLGMGTDKLIEVPLLEGEGLDYAHQIVANLEILKKAVAAKQIPDRITDLTICDDCDARHLCMPDQQIGAEEVVFDKEFEELLVRREELASARKEYEELDKAVKERILSVGKNSVQIGMYLATVKSQTRKSYTVEGGDYKTVNIKKIS